MVNTISQSQMETTAVPKTLGRLEKACYGVGDFASNLIWGTLSSFLLYFYTDVALLPVVAIGNIFLISRVLDAFVDPVVGSFVDGTNTSRGRTKPYIFWGILPLCIFFVLSFTTPDASDGIKVAYAYGTYIIVGLLYSLVNVPYGALMSLMTRKEEDLSQLSSLRMIGMALGSVLVTAVTMPLVNILGSGDMRLGFLEVAIIYSLAAMGCFALILRNCHERNCEIQQEKRRDSLLSVYRRAIKNKPWVVTIAFAFLLFVRLGAMVAVTIFFCLHGLKNPTLISVLLPLLYISAVVSASIMPAIVKRLQFRKANILAAVIYMASFAILPLLQDNMPAFMILYFFANALGGISMGAVFGMIASCVDYNEWQFGRRCEGTLYAGYSFATKVGMAVGGAFVGYGLAFIGYDAQNVTAQAGTAITWLYYGIPVVFSALMALVVSFYKLDDKHEQIVAELEASHEQA